MMGGMRLVHTSDWQIGKSFRFADDATLSVLQEQRLEAILRLGALARAEEARTVLVAGDVWDVAVPSDRTLRQTAARMAQCPDIAWHLIPGNHDPNRPGGAWERLARLDVPPNVHLHLVPEPVRLGSDGMGRDAWLLPAPLGRRHVAGDPTGFMEDAATPDGALRIGLAHGSVTAFGSDPTEGHNLIAPDRAERAGLAYLALGDWHGTRQIGTRSFYSGTPEPDGFDRGGDGGGSALLVDLSGGQAAVAPRRVGRFSWRRESASLFGPADLEALEARLRQLAGDSPSEVLVWLSVSGALGLEEQAIFHDRIEEGLGSALRLLRIDRAHLGLRATAADAEALGPAGAVRAAGDVLAARAADPADPARELAEAALQRLHLLVRRGEALS